MMFAVAVLLMFAITIEKTDGVCCHSSGGRCGDCSWGTPYCSYRPCNLFGCACQSSCREGNCHAKKGWLWRKRRSTKDKDAVQVFHSYDFNNNGKIEILEFTVAFNQTGLTEEELFVQWRKMDDNKDGVITIDEMDHDEF